MPPPSQARDGAASSVHEQRRKSDEGTADGRALVKLSGGLLVALVALAGCGGRSTRELAASTGGSTSGSGGGSGAGGVAGSFVTNSTGVDGLGCPGVPITNDEFQRASRAACKRVNVGCEELPADLHLVVEASSRMNDTIDGVSKWNMVRNAIERLSFSSPSTGLSLRAFGASGASDDARVCDPATYAEPTVPTGYGAAGLAAMLEALNEIEPDGRAPSVPALAGALDDVTRLQGGTSVAQRVVLIVAGAPTACAGTPEALRTTFASSNVTSYVIALEPDFDVGPVAADTETWPFVVARGDSPTRLADALAHVARGASRRTCDFGTWVPDDPSLAIAPERTRAFFAGSEVPRLASEEECTASPHGGFYLSADAGALQFRSCPCSCARYATCYGAEWLFYCE